MNIADDKKLIPFVERFREGTRTMETDLINLSNLYTSGMKNVIKKLAYDEMVTIFAAFNGALLTEPITLSLMNFTFENLLSEVNPFDLRTLSTSDDREKLLKKIEEFGMLEKYAIVDFARRFWDKNEIDTDKRMTEIGLDKKVFSNPNP